MGMNHSVAPQIWASQKSVIASAVEDVETGKYAGVIVDGPEEDGKILISTSASYATAEAAKLDMRKLIADAIAQIDEELKTPEKSHSSPWDLGLNPDSQKEHMR